MTSPAALILTACPTPRTCAFKLIADDLRWPPGVLSATATATSRCAHRGGHGTAVGFPGKVVAQVMGLTPSYVATLHQRALREGAAGLARPSGPSRSWARRTGRSTEWRAAGAGEAEIAARLGVAQSTVTHLGSGQRQLPGGEPPEREKSLFRSRRLAGG